MNLSLKALKQENIGRLKPKIAAVLNVCSNTNEFLILHSIKTRVTNLKFVKKTLQEMMKMQSSFEIGMGMNTGSVSMYINYINQFD